MRASLLTILLLMTVGCEDDNGPTSPSAPSLSFFVTSATSVTGNLGGLAGADATCQRLATAVGERQHIWRAYLSVERDPANNNRPTHARDRIGTGPWYNAGLQLIANSVAELHSRTGDAALFVDERGQRINGQWTGSPSPVEHDILTGSNADGTVLAGMTCADWTSDSASVAGQVGHSDGMGPSQNTAGPSLVLELCARQPELREHGASRRSGQDLLFRGAMNHVASCCMLTGSHTSSGRHVRRCERCSGALHTTSARPGLVVDKHR